MNVTVNKRCLLNESLLPSNIEMVIGLVMVTLQLMCTLKSQSYLSIMGRVVKHRQD